MLSIKMMSVIYNDNYDAMQSQRNYRLVQLHQPIVVEEVAVAEMMIRVYTIYIHLLL